MSQQNTLWVHFVMLSVTIQALLPYCLQGDIIQTRLPSWHGLDCLPLVVIVGAKLKKRIIYGEPRAQLKT